MTDRIRKGGSTEDTPQRTAPENPAERKPARTARLMAIAPGEDWAMAAISISSSSENRCFSVTKYLRIMGITT